MFQFKNLTFFTTLLFLLIPEPSPIAAAELRFVIWKSEAPQLWDRAVADFERQNPGIKVIREVGPHSSTQFHDLVTQKLKNRVEPTGFACECEVPREEVAISGTIGPRTRGVQCWPST